MDEDIVSIDDLKRCINCLVSVETASGDIYQGRVDAVYDDMSTLVLLRPFKTGRPINAPKFPLYINAVDVVKIIEPAPQQLAASSAKSAPRQQKQKPAAQVTRVCDELQSINLSTPKAPPQQPRQYTALELLNRAQAKQAVQNSPTTVDIPTHSNGFDLLSRPQNPSKSQQTNGGGPSGNPIMDFLSGHVHKGKQHTFDQPIDMDELKQDFDFDGNLEYFNKRETNYQFGSDELDDLREVDGEDYRIVYEDKTAPSFRHDENIISDPKRVTSWVNKTTKAKQLAQNQQRPNNMPTPTVLIRDKKHQLLQSTPTSVVSSSTPARKQVKSNEKPCNSTGNNGAVDEYSSLRLKAYTILHTDNGAVLPVLKKNEKQILLEATTRMYTEHIYSIVLADRFTEYVFDFQKRYSLFSKQMLIIAGQSCDPIVLHRFMQYFYNRGFTLHIYDPPHIPGQLENKAQIYRDVTDLPTDLPAIYMLCAQTFHLDEELRRWVLRLSRPSQMNPNMQKLHPNKLHYPRIVALDFRLFDIKYMHTLYVAAVDESATNSGRMQHNPNEPILCTFEAYVADLGTPFSWISCVDATPVDAFRNSLICRLIIS